MLSFQALKKIDSVNHLDKPEETGMVVSIKREDKCMPVHLDLQGDRRKTMLEGPLLQLRVIEHWYSRL